MSVRDPRYHVPVSQVDRLGAARWNPERTIRAVVAPDRPAGLAVDLLLQPQGGCSDMLFVSMHGSTDRERYSLPRFEWLTTLRERRHNIVCVTDTTLGLAHSLQLAWYLGTEDDDLTARIADVLESIRDQLGVRRTVVLGSSGGGFAAAQLAHRMADTLGLAFSPQVRLAGFYRRHSEAVRTLAFPGSTSIADWEERHRLRVDLSARYAESEPAGRLWFIQNTADAHHLDRHRRLFEQRVGTAGGRIAYFDLPYGDGHVPPPRQLVLSFLDAAATGDWSDLMDDTRPGPDEGPDTPDLARP